MATVSTRHWIRIALVAIVVAAGLYWYTSPQNTIEQRPRLDVTLLDGQRLALSQWDGQAVLVNFWATSCKTCLEEMPELIAVYEKYRARGLRVLGIAMPYDRPDYVTEMTRERPIPYPVALDPEGRAIRAFGNVGLTPTTFVFDPAGKLVYYRVGRIDFEALEDVIKQVLTHRERG